MRFVPFLAGLLLMMHSAISLADEQFNGVEAICLSESNVIRVQHRSTDAQEPANRKTCSLGASNFVVDVRTDERRAQGRCAAQPPTWLTIRRDGVIVVGPAWFGVSCGQGPTISSVEYFGPLNRLTVCVSPSGLMTGVEICAHASGLDLPVGDAWLKKVVKDARAEPF